MEIISSKTSRRTSVPLALFIIFIVILVAVLFSRLAGNGNEPLTFRALLNWIENYHPWIDNLNFIDLTIQGDWGILDGLRTFINALAGIFSFGLYITGALVNAISYITGLVQFLFVG